MRSGRGAPGFARASAASPALAGGRRLVRVSLVALAVALAILVAGCGPGEAAPGDALPEGDAPGNAALEDGAPRAAEPDDAAPPTDAAGADDARVILVTGSTDGLGRALALRLAPEGPHLIVHGRDEERGREVVAAAEEAGAASARFYPADFAELARVEELAEAIVRDYDRLDVLVNNAGVGPGAPGHERVLTPDGHELRFQVNYLAGYLLTHELLPLLRESAPSRVVNVSSRSQQPLDFDDLRMDRRYSGGLAYGRSKLAQILLTFDLADELEGTGVGAYAVHPAPAMDTELVRETGGQPQSTVARGVESVYRAVTRDDLESGTFFFELEPARAHAQAYDEEARRRLREASERMVREAREP